MSDNNRDLFGKVSKPKDALLDELDSLKELLDEEGEDIIMAAPWEFTPSKESAAVEIDIAAMPEADEVIELSHPFTTESSANGLVDETPFEIPVLDEVVELADEAEPASPDSEELLHLVEMLVERRLHKLKPVLTAEVLEELQRFYPSLKNR